MPEARVAPMRQLLNGLCRPDVVHRPARVVTVYCDTPDLKGLDEKINSDYLKTKVRIRWYASLDGAVMNAAFAECKYRVGSTRRKLRASLAIPAARIAGWPLESGEWGAAFGALRAVGVDVPRDVAPVLRLWYVRERFRDVFGGGRVTLDTRLTVDAVSHSRLGAGLTGTFPGGVVEHKSTSSDLPAHLEPIIRMGAREGSFSKYLAGYVHVTRAVF